MLSFLPDTKVSETLKIGNKKIPDSVTIRIKAVVFALFLSSSATASEPVPKAEYGLGIAALYLPDYHASDQSQGYILPLPMVIYRGDVVKLDDEGMRGRLVDLGLLKINISIGAGLPVDGRRNEARQGMENLAPSLEAGPEIKLQDALAEGWAWVVAAPIRAVLSSDFKRIDYRGAVFVPYLGLVQSIGSHPLHGMRLLYRTGPMYGNQPYHSYFYGVADQDVTEDRPAYRAQAGYAGWRYEVSYYIRSGGLWIGGFVRHEDLVRATFEDSPLYRSPRYTALGLGMAWLTPFSSSPPAGGRP